MMDITMASMMLHEVIVVHMETVEDGLGVVEVKAEVVEALIALHGILMLAGHGVNPTAHHNDGNQNYSKTIFVSALVTYCILILRVVILVTV